MYECNIIIWNGNFIWFPMGINRLIDLIRFKIMKLSNYLGNRSK